MRNLLKTLIKEIILESTSSRITTGDATQKKIAAWLVQKDEIVIASVNKPGSGSTDVIASRRHPNVDAKIESKSSISGYPVYSQELFPGSEIAKVINFVPGEPKQGLSLERFKPAENGKPVVADAANIRQIQDGIIQTALSEKNDGYQVLFGGISKPSAPEKQPMTLGSQFMKTLSPDGTIVINTGTGFRQTVIVLAPGDVGDKSRLRFWADGSSKLRAALGGKGQQSLGTYERVDDNDLTVAWRKDYKKNDDYFAIVTGDEMHIGYIEEDKLLLGLPQLSVKLKMPEGANTLTYGGTKISGLREKIMIEIVGATVVKIPTIEVALDYQKEGKIIVR